MDRADKGMAFLLRYENIAWYDSGKVRILDRRIYPLRTEFVTCVRHEEVAQAIADMVTQSGGPYTAAAMGMALAAYEAQDKKGKDYCEYMKRAAYTLSHARPTTAAKMKEVVSRSLGIVRSELKCGRALSEIPDILRQDAVDILDKKYKRFDKIAFYLASHIPAGGTVMTQCFGETIVGALLRECRRQKNAIKMICAETRPYYQGARLTASVSYEMGFDTTVITDNMPAYTMKEKHVDVFTSAADVITMDGHIVNKIGTFQMALAAWYLSIPYFVTGVPDREHTGIDSVEIELRDPEAVTQSMGQKHTLTGVKGYYPAFDVTPPKLCDGVITERGIFSPFDLYSYFEK